MKTLLKIALVFFLTLSLQAQQKTITGTVISKSDGMALPGLNVVIKGTSDGVQTDFEGKYKILASKGVILKFSYVGFITQEN